MVRGWRHRPVGPRGGLCAQPTAPTPGTPVPRGLVLGTPRLVRSPRPRPRQGEPGGQAARLWADSAESEDSASKEGGGSGGPTSWALACLDPGPLRPLPETRRLHPDSALRATELTTFPETSEESDARFLPLGARSPRPVPPRVSHCFCCCLSSRERPQRRGGQQCEFGNRSRLERQPCPLHTVWQAGCRPRRPCRLATDTAGPALQPLRSCRHSFILGVVPQRNGDLAFV